VFRAPGPIDLRAYRALSLRVISSRAGHIHLMANRDDERFEWLVADVAYEPRPGWTTVEIPIPDHYRKAARYERFHLFVNWQDQPAETFHIDRIRLVR
jgi:hypothetical protein